MRPTANRSRPIENGRLTQHRREAVTRWRQWLEGRQPPDQGDTQVAAKDGQ